eukprot:213009-Rhodomonas_salina.2
MPGIDYAMLGLISQEGELGESGPICLRASYAMSGTDITHLPTGCPVLAYRMILPVYGMSGTDIPYGPTCLQDVRY